MSDRIRSLFAKPAEIEAQQEKDRAARRTIQGLFAARPTPPAATATEPAPAEPANESATESAPAAFDEAAATEAAKKLDVVELCAALEAAGRPIERAQIAGEPKGAHLALVSRLVEAKRAAAMAVRRDVELAPPPPPASTPEPGAQAQEMQLIFDNNQNFVAYHEVVPGKTFDDLKALFPTDEEWEMFVMAAASYLPREVWEALFHPPAAADISYYCSVPYEFNKIEGLQKTQRVCRDEAGALKLKANYECVLARYPLLKTVLAFKMDEEKKVLAAFKAMVPTIPLVWQCAAADVLVPQTPAQRDSVLLSATTKRLIELEKQLEETRAERDAARREAQKETATLAERDQRIASSEKQLEETRAELDAAREDAQKKTSTIAERDERIASLEHCIANIEFHCDATHGA